MSTSASPSEMLAANSLDYEHSQSQHEEVVIVSWEPNDPENPYNWPSPKKTAVLLLNCLLVINSTMGSSLPSMAMPAIAHTFAVSSPAQQVLPISVYLAGYVVGPLLCGPLSEHFGRRNLTIVTFAVFSLFTMACALASSWPAFLVFRLVCGAFASSPITVGAGILADIYGEPRERGRAFTIFIVTTTFGPVFSPILSGVTTDTIGWRWAFWIALVCASLTLVMAVFLPETFGPILLSRRANNLRKQSSSSPSIVAPRDLEAVSLSQLLSIVLTRPLRMLISEPIVSSTCAYLALVYAIFYMSFEAFPIVFQTIYGLSPAGTGLAYLPIGAGACLSMPIFWLWDNVRASSSWTDREEYRRLPLACLGGPLFVISLFWLGFTARDSVSFVLPMLAGVPFGMGFVLIFVALLNYLTDAYEIFAASANAASSTSRSLCAVVLPLAAAPMFKNLGISGALSLLGGLSAVMCVIPFVFIWKGPSIRRRSPFCIALCKRKEEVLRKAEEERKQLERVAMGEKGSEAV